MEYKKKIGEKTLLLRPPEESDAEEMLNCLKTVCGETRFLLKDPDEITFTVDDEKNFINAVNSSKIGVMLVGFLDGEYVGHCSLSELGRKRFSHRVDLGISLYQKFTGFGIGTFMIEKLIEIAKEKGLEQITLEVSAENKRAVAIYKKFGFEIYGTFPKNMKYKDGTYSDVIWMMKEL